MAVSLTRIPVSPPAHRPPSAQAASCAAPSMPISPSSPVVLAQGAALACGSYRRRIENAAPRDASGFVPMSASG